MADPDPEVCEVCGASPLVKVLHPVPIHFKGSGFYSTDYGRGARKREADGGGDSGGSGDSGETKKDTKSGGSGRDSGSGEKVEKKTGKKTAADSS